MAFGGLISDRGQRLYLARAAEGTFGTAGTLTHLFNPLDGFQASGISPEMLSDRGHATGKEFMTKQYPGRRRPTMQVPLPLSPAAWGFGWGFGLGKDTVSGATDYVHRFELLAANSLMLGLTAQYHANGATYDSDTDWKTMGNYVREVKWTISRQGWSRIDLDIAGAGYYEAGSTVTESSLQAPECLIPNPKCRVRLKAAGTEGTTEWGGTWTAQTNSGVFANTMSSDIDLTPYLDTITFTVRNNPEGEDAAGTSVGVGSVGGRPKVGVARDVIVDCTWWLGTDTKAIDRVLANATQANNAEYSLLAEWVSDTVIGSNLYSGGLIVPLAGLTQKPTPSGGLGQATRTANFEAKNVTAGTDYGAIRAYLISATSGVFGAA